MKKKVLLFAIACVSSITYAATWTDPDTGINWTYTIGSSEFSGGEWDSSVCLSNDGESVIPTDVAGVVKVPATINGKPVRIIGSSAFSNCGTITRIEIPETVTAVGGNVFVGCNSLRTVAFKGNAPTCMWYNYQWYNFAICYKDGSTGWGDSELRMWISPVCVPKDGGYTATVSANEEEEGVNRVSYGYVVSGFSATITSCKKEGYNSVYEKIIVPAELDNCIVTAIGDDAFSRCELVNSLELPEGVVSIGREAFKATSFKTIILPKSLKELGYAAFRESGIEHIAIPDEVSDLPRELFYDCWHLESVELGSGFRTWSKYYYLVDNNGAFLQMEGTFVCCSLTNIVVSGSNPKYSSADGCLLSKDGETLLLVPYACEKLRVPEGVRNLGDSCARTPCIGNVEFALSVTNIGPQSLANTGLSNVVVPDNVESIQDGAFSDSRLKSIFFGSGFCYLGYASFFHCAALRQVKFAGNAPELEWKYPIGSREPMQRGFEGVNASCKCLVSCKTTGWGDVPGIWNGLPTQYYDVEFELILDANGGEPEIQTVVVTNGQHYGALPTPVRRGYRFNGWHASQLDSERIEETTIVGDYERLFAHWASYELGDEIEETIDGVTWQGLVEHDNCVKVLSAYPATGTLVLPMDLNGLSVVCIGAGAFEGCMAVTAVEIPKSVTNIESRAFAGCGCIKEVVVPSGFIVKEVFPDANITSVTFADGVEYIESSFLAGLSVNSIVVPDSVTSIEDNALSVGRAITFKGECPDNYVYSGILDATSVTLPSKSSAAYMTYPKVSEVLGVYALKGLSGESTPMTQVEGALYFNTTDHVDSQCAENTFKALSLSWIYRYYDHSGRFETSTNELENASAALHTQFWYSSNYRFTLRVPWCTSRDDEICLMATSDRFVGSTLDDVLDYMIPWLKCEVAEVKNLGDVDLNRGDIIAISAPAQSEVAILCDANEYPLDNYSSAERWAAPADVGIALDGVYYWQVPDMISDSKGEWELWGEHREFPRCQGDGDQFFPIDFIVCVGGEETSYEVQSYKDVASVTFDTGIHSQNGEIFKTYLSKGKSRGLGLWQPFYICEDPWFDDWIEVHEEKWPSYWKQQQGGTVTPEWNSWASPETLASMSLEWGYGQPPPTHYEYHTAGWSVEPGWVFIGWRIVEGYWDSAPIESFDEENGRSFPELQPTVRDAGVYGDDGIRFVAEYAPITNKIEYVDLKGCANSNPTNFTVLDEIEFSPLSDPKGWHFVGWNPARIEAGTVGDVVVTALWEVAISIPEAAGDNSRQWKTHGDAEWYAAWSDERCDWFVRSGEIGDSQMTTLETCVTNAGLVSFDLRVSCEDWYRGVKTDGVTVAVDDEVRLVQGVCDWTNVCLRIEGEGEHIITWSYTKDVEGCGREDCACLANFVFAEEATLRFEGQSFCSGEPPEQIVTFVGECVGIPGSNTLSYDKHRFVGWQNGEAIYRAGDVCEIESTLLTFTAVWEAKILASPSISVQSYYETEKTLVTIVGDGNGDIYYTLDGSIPTANSSRYVDPFEVAGSFTITAISLKDGWFESAAVVAKTQRAPWLVEECLNTTNLSLRTGGDAPWLRDLTQSHDEVASMRSGEISNTETSWIETTVEGSGAISFWWKGSTEKFRDTIFDVGTFEVDGDKKYEIGGETDWIFVSAKIDGSGSHTLRWQYTKDYEDDPGLVGECDCIWLDEVTWTPDAVALTLDDLAEVFGDDSDVAKNITDDTELTAFNGFLKDCSINSATDLKSAQKQYAYLSFKLAEIMTAPLLFEEEPVLKIDDIELSGGNLSLTISLTAGAETIQLAKDKLAEKIRVGTTLGDITGKPNITAHPAADGTSLTFTITPPEGDRGFVKVQID